MDSDNAPMGEPLSEAEQLRAENTRLLRKLQLSSKYRQHSIESRRNLERKLIGWREATEKAAAERDAATSRVGVLEGQLATAQERHQPVRRYHGPDTDDRSFETPEEAAEYDDVPPSAVRHFDICKTCGDMEVHDDEWRAYEWSLWPCKEAVALGLDGGGSDAE